MSMVDSAPPFVSRERRAGDGGVWCVLAQAGGYRLCVSVDGAGRLTARWWRAPSAPLALLAAPGVRGCAPLPPDPYPRQAELAGICALRAHAALRAGVFLCWRMQRPACVRAGGALLPRCSLRSQPPRAGAARPYPRTPARGKLSLQAFARCRARAALRAGVAVLAHGATRRVVLAHAATRPCALARATTRPCVLSLSFGRVSPRRSAIAPRLP